MQMKQEAEEAVIQLRREQWSSQHGRAIIYSKPHMNCRATTRGVFKAYVGFFADNFADVVDRLLITFTLVKD